MVRLLGVETCASCITSYLPTRNLRFVRPVSIGIVYILAFQTSWSLVLPAMLRKRNSLRKQLKLIANCLRIDRLRPVSAPNTGIECAAPFILLPLIGFRQMFPLCHTSNHVLPVTRLAIHVWLWLTLFANSESPRNSRYLGILSLGHLLNHRHR